MNRTDHIDAAISTEILHRLSRIEEEPTLLQRNVGRLIRWLGLLAILFCLIVVAVYGLLRGDWFAGALTGITLAVALLPEEFPMVLAVFSPCRSASAA